MAVFRVVSLNCYNLFAAGIHRNRGPQTAQALSVKINHLAATITTPFAATLPDIVCLCEVGEEALGRRLADAIASGFYQTLWSGTSDQTQTGLMICYNAKVVQNTANADDRNTRNAGERCKWLAAQFVLRNGSRARFWLVLNHWKSQMGGESQTEPSRSNSAAEVGKFFLGTARRSSEAMLLLGDFNCEPGAIPFKKPANYLRAMRERAVVLRDRNRLAYFYNPMWRMHGEADAYETTRRAGYQSPRPPGTYCPINKSIGWTVFDHILVSKRLLTGGPIRFMEASLRVVRAQQQCSDHCALAAEFEYD